MYREVERVQYILCAGKLVLVHLCGVAEPELVPAVVRFVAWVVERVNEFGLSDHAGDFLEIVLEGFSVGFPGEADGGTVVLWEASAPCVCDEVVEGGSPDEIFFSGRAAVGQPWAAGCVVEEGLDEGTEGIDDVPDAVCGVLDECGPVDGVVEETGAAGECGDVLGEIVEDGDGCGVGRGGGLECEGELRGEVVDEGEEGVEIAEDEGEGGVAGGGVGEGGEGGGAGPGEEGEGEDGWGGSASPDVRVLGLTLLLVRHRGPSLM